jgi:hypothetical protein
MENPNGFTTGPPHGAGDVVNRKDAPGAAVLIKKIMDFNFFKSEV